MNMGFDFFILLLIIAIGAYAVSNSVHIAFMFNNAIRSCKVYLEKVLNYLRK